MAKKSVQEGRHLPSKNLGRASMGGGCATIACRNPEPSMPITRRLVCLSALGYGAVSAQTLAPVSCTMSARVVTLKVVDARGQPVDGAQLVMRRLSTGQNVPSAAWMGSQGDYKLLEDAELPDLRPAGEDFEVRLSKDGRSRVLTLRIGMDTQGCHITVLKGERRVVL
jgi:hypothetical protein